MRQIPPNPFEDTNAAKAQFRNDPTDWARERGEFAGKAGDRDNLPPTAWD